MKNNIFILFFLSAFFSFAQSKLGYWDNIRTTNQTFTLKSSDIKTIKSADFPTGTTEAVLRITLLDDNQKVSNSLSSILKSIPDPTGISQATAGALFLSTSIVGEDKCKYAIFTSSVDAENYAKTKTAKNACIVQETAVNKDVVLLNASSKCIPTNAKNIWICFESDNWVMNEKVVLEIVPWIDNKLSRGWNVDTKNELLNTCNQLAISQYVSNKNLFCSNFIESISQKYTYKEFTDLLPIEKSKLFDAVSDEILTKNGEKLALSNYYYALAKKMYDAGNKQQAIDLLQSKIIDKGNASAKDYSNLGFYYLLSNQLDKAENTLLQGIQLDPTELSLQLNLAHCYLFKGELSKAKDLHKNFRAQNITATVSWVQQTRLDFLLFEKNGLPKDDFKKILKIID